MKGSTPYRRRQRPDDCDLAALKVYCPICSAQPLQACRTESNRAMLPHQYRRQVSGFVGVASAARQVPGQLLLEQP